jgi:DNA-binding NtrC family response regulator
MIPSCPIESWGRHQERLGIPSLKRVKSGNPQTSNIQAHRHWSVFLMRQLFMPNGAFRQDLYYRLNVFPLEMPPLRARRADIPLLVEYFIDRYARKAGKNIRSVDKKTLQLLQSYPWPGNIRELQNVIERSLIVCETEIFTVDESWLSQRPLDTRSGNKLFLSEKVAATEREIIEEALRESQGRIFGPSGAAAKLGIARSTLESKIRLLKINKNRFKAPSGT